LAAAKEEIAKLLDDMQESSATFVEASNTQLAAINNAQKMKQLLGGDAGRASR
jgi:hypothetical protein